MARRDDAPPQAREFAPLEGEQTPPAPATALTPFQQQVASMSNETSGVTLAARARAEIEARTFLALRNPRQFDLVRDRLLKTCERFRFADSAIYSKPMGKGKEPVEGLSTRFAEEFARSWGNLDITVTVVDETPEYRELEATAFDFETNLTFRETAIVEKFVERKSPRDGDEIISKRTNSVGSVTFRIRAHEDALLTKTNAIASKARREAILRHCPADLRDECWEKCEQTLAALAGKDPEKFIAWIIQTFSKRGVSSEELTAYLGKSPRTLTVEEAQRLGKLASALKNGELTWKEAVDRKRESEAEDVEIQKTNAADAKNGEKKAAAPQGKGTAGLKADLKKQDGEGDEADRLARARTRYNELKAKGDMRTDDESAEMADLTVDFPEVVQ